MWSSFQACNCKPGTIAHLDGRQGSSSFRKSLFCDTLCCFYLFSSLGSTCSSICKHLLAQVAREQKRLDARVMWLAAFSQVAPDIRRFIKWAETMELVCRMSHLMKLFCQHCTDTRIAVAEKVQKSSF